MLIFTSAAILVFSGISLEYLRRLKSSSKFSAVFIEKYDALYRSLTNKRPAEIIKSSATRILVKVKVNGDAHYFGLEELDSRLMITWKLNSPEFGKTSKEWSFNPNSPQNWMYEEVLGDIREFQLNQIKQKRNAAAFTDLKTDTGRTNHFKLA